MLKSHDAKLLFPPCYPAAAGEGESPALSPFFSDCPIDDVHSPDTAGADGVHSTTMTILTLIAPELGMGPTCSTSLMSMNYIIDIHYPERQRSAWIWSQLVLRVQDSNLTLIVRNKKHSTKGGPLFSSIFVSPRN
jgi:hypothetical protein